MQQACWIMDAHLKGNEKMVLYPIPNHLIAA
jgi:hypothetical protein